MSCPSVGEVLLLDGDTIRIEGYSKGADRLIETLDAAPGFTDARFVAPLVHQSDRNADRFDLTFKRRKP